MKFGVSLKKVDGYREKKLLAISCQRLAKEEKQKKKGKGFFIGHGDTDRHRQKMKRQGVK